MIFYSNGGVASLDGSFIAGDIAFDRKGGLNGIDCIAASFLYLGFHFSIFVIVVM